MDSRLLFRIRKNKASFLILLVIMIFSMFLFRKSAMYILLTAAAGIFVYLNYYIRLPFDVSPVLFLSLVITQEYTFLLSTLFIFLSGIVPMLLAGGSFDHTTLFYISLIILVNLFFSRLPSGLILSFLVAIAIHHLISMAGGIFFGNSHHKEFLNLIIKVAVDFSYVFMLSRIIVSLIY